ncbi:MAG: hypothetical protein U5L04_02440 [Trueperaceae bacterium]|nr:hypothetical protein [Trueperaceae bacterium]
MNQQSHIDETRILVVTTDVFDLHPDDWPGLTKGLKLELVEENEYGAWGRDVAGDLHFVPKPDSYEIVEVRGE